MSLCLFCDQNISHDYAPYGDRYKPNNNTYICARCGIVRLTEEVYEDFPSCRFSESEKSAISITLRQDWERNGKNPIHNKDPKTVKDLYRIVEQYRPLDPLEKIDFALFNFDKESQYVGGYVDVTCYKDYPYYYCSESNELYSILHLAEEDELIKIRYDYSDPGINQLVDQGIEPRPVDGFTLTTKGYQRLREIKRPNQESKQAFVAMWFDPSMKDAYDYAIEPAIQYKEYGENTSRFKALKIDNKEHVNDINDQIIAEIRRSRFMVCDLTGYRGGVYFEAGFAYGLGIPVIYTCRRDWTKPESLKDENGNETKELYDENDQAVRVGKEGVHFDLNHRNRIEWDPEELDDFKIKLERRIKAVIY